MKHGLLIDESKARSEMRQGEIYSVTCFLKPKVKILCKWKYSNCGIIDIIYKFFIDIMKLINTVKHDISSL